MGGALVFLGERFERLVHRNHLGRIPIEDGGIVVQRLALAIAAALDRHSGAGPVDEDGAHRGARGVDEVPSVLPCAIVVADELDVSLVHQVRWPQRLTRREPRKARVREASELVVDERQQAVDSVGIATDGGFQDLGDGMIAVLRDGWAPRMVIRADPLYVRGSRMLWLTRRQRTCGLRVGPRVGFS